MEVTINFPDDLNREEIEKRLYQLQAPAKPSTIEARLAVHLRETIDTLSNRVAMLEMVTSSMVDNEDLAPKIEQIRDRLNQIEVDVEHDRASLAAVNELNEEIRKLKIRQTKQKAGYIQRTETLREMIQRLRDSLGANIEAQDDALRHASGDRTADAGDTERNGTLDQGDGDSV